MKKNKVVDDLTKKVVYLFKQYARKEGFWEEYKKLSSPLNDKRNPKTFIQVVEENEPVKLIQNCYAFCSWPCSFTSHGKTWERLSADWARICIRENLYRSESIMYTYIDMNIPIARQEKRRLLEEYWKKTNKNEDIWEKECIFA